MNKELEELGTSKVTARFQITVPERARELLGLTNRDYGVFAFDKSKNEVLIRSARLVLKKRST